MWEMKSKLNSVSTIVVQGSVTSMLIVFARLESTRTVGTDTEIRHAPARACHVCSRTINIMQYKPLLEEASRPHLLDQ